MEDNVTEEDFQYLSSTTYHTKTEWSGQRTHFLTKYLQFDIRIYYIWPGMSQHCCRLFFKRHTVEYQWH